MERGANSPSDGGKPDGVKPGRAKSAGPWTIAALLTLICFARSFALLGLNRAEYTDGILMVGRDLFGPTYWPPGYSWAAKALSFLYGGDREAGGRLVSALANALALFPITYLGLWLADQARINRQRLVLLIGLLFIASPVPFRWSLRVMSDSLFLVLFWGAIACLAAGWSARDSGIKTGRLGAGDLLFGKSALWMSAAAIIGLLSAFVRNQGIFFVPLWILVAAAICWVPSNGGEDDRPIHWRIGVLLLSVFAWVLWPVIQGGQLDAHTGQVGFRTMQGGGFTWLSVLQVVAMFEAFLYLTPYFVTPLLFGLAAYGLIRGAMTPGRALLAGGVALLFMGMIYGSQSFFQSFLSRYLLPVIPIFCILAALGAEALIQRRKVVGWIITSSVVIFGLVFGGLVVSLQRGAFGDIAEAAVALSEIETNGAPIYSNEVYKPEAGMGAIKLRWWSGHRIQMIQEMPPGGPPSGAIIVLCSGYGGPEFYNEFRAQLMTAGRAEVIAGPFKSSLVPLLPDIMMSAQGGHQSPMAWIYRFAPQYFETVILRIP